MADGNSVILCLIRDAILSVTRQLDGGDVNEDKVDYLAFRLEQLYGHVLRLTGSDPRSRAAWGGPPKKIG